MVAETERPSTPEDDHLGRVRIAATVGLTRREPPATTDQSRVTNSHTKSAAQLALARAGLRSLAAAGPLTLQAIAGAAARSRRFRDRAPMSDGELATALTAVGCTVDDRNRWHPIAGAVPTDRDQRIVALAAGRDLTGTR